MESHKITAQQPLQYFVIFRENPKIIKIEKKNISQTIIDWQVIFFAMSMNR